MAKQTLILDSTRISTFLECNEKLNLAYNENLTLSNEIDDDLAGGSYGHKLLEIYYKEKERVGAIKAIEMAHQFHLSDQFPISSEAKLTIKDRFEYYVMRYANENYQTLIKRDKKTIGIFENSGLPYTKYECEPLVEQGFSYKLLDTKEYLFVLEGRIDWMVEIQGINAWVDHKFQSRKRNLYEKAIQFRNYSLATGLFMGVINYIRLHKKIEDDTLYRQVVQFSPLEIRLWKERLIEIFIRIAKSTRENKFEKNEDSCSGKFGYRCQFTQICEESNPQTIINIKNTRYTKREEWKPW